MTSEKGEQITANNNNTKRLTLPKGVEDFVAEAGGMSRFAWKFFAQAFKPPYEWRETLKQCYEVGNTSLGLVSITAFIIGLVMTIQSRPTLVEFGAEALL